MGNYLNFFNIPKFQQPAVTIQRNDATRVASPKESSKPIKRIFPYTTPVLSEDTPKSESEKRKSDEKLELYGNIEKEQKDLQQGLETFSAGLDYTSPSYWVNKNGGHLSVAESLGLDFATYIALGGLTGLVKQGVCTITKSGLKTDAKLLKKSIEKAGYKKYFAKNGEWNLPLLNAERDKGIKAAEDYFKSDVKAQANLHNEALAKRLGYTGFEVDAGAGRIQQSSPKRKFTLNNTEDGTGIIRNKYNPSKDEITYNVFSGEVPALAYHEELHRGYLGEGNPYLSKNIQIPLWQRVTDTKNFESWKVKHLLKSDLSGNKYANYLHDDGELAANIMELGYRAGIAPGTPYPGDQKVLEILQNLKKQHPTKAFVVEALDTKHPKRIWDALTGRYFILTGLLNSNNENSLK